MSLMKEILDAKVGRDEVLVCFLGQTGFIFRTPEVSLCVDPYLSDSCAKNERMTKELGVALVAPFPSSYPPRNWMSISCLRPTSTKTTPTRKP